MTAITPKRNSRYSLLNKDCVAGMRALKAGSVGVAVTSPPYNIGIDYASYDDTMSRAEYLEWCREWMSEVLRVLTDDGSFFLNVGASPREPLFPHQMAILAVECGFRIQNTFHWVKSISVPTSTGDILSVGHFKPINSKRFVNDCHEYIFHLTKTGDIPLDRLALGVPYQDKSNIARWGHTKGHDKRCRGNMWFIPYKTIQSSEKDRPHPASFPKELVTNCLKIASATPETCVMDPFLGIGTSAVAAKEFGILKFTGFEIDAGYLDVAKAAQRKAVWPVVKKAAKRKAAAPKTVVAKPVKKLAKTRKRSAAKVKKRTWEIPAKSGSVMRR